MPDTSYVVAHSRETHFEHSFPDGSSPSLFQEISLPVASAAFHDKVEAHWNDTYASQKDNRKEKRNFRYTAYPINIEVVKKIKISKYKN